MNATGHSPSTSSARATTAAATTHGADISAFSTSALYTFSPPTSSISLRRSMILKNPCACFIPTSPVRNQPSGVNPSLVATSSPQYPLNTVGPRICTSPALRESLGTSRPSISTIRTSIAMNGRPLVCVVRNWKSLGLRLLIARVGNEKEILPQHSVMPYEQKTVAFGKRSRTERSTRSGTGEPPQLNRRMHDRCLY